MRADEVHAWAVAALGGPVIMVVHLGLTGTAPGAPAVLATVAAVLITAWSLGRLQTRLAPHLTARAGLFGRALVAAFALLAGQLALAATDLGARSGGCLPTVGQGTQVGYRWLVLDPAVPCADGVTAAPLTLAGVTAALAAVGAALGLVLAQLGIALAAATAGLRLSAATALAAMNERLAVLAVLISRFLVRSLVGLLEPAPVALPARVTRHGRADVPRPRAGSWARVPARRGPPPAPIAQPG